MSENKKTARDLEQRGDVASLKVLYQGAAISRRAFVSRLTALGISASVAGIIVAGSPVAVAATPVAVAVVAILRQRQTRARIRRSTN